MAQKSKKDYGPLDAVQEAMGVIGPWQIMIAVLLSLINIPVAWNQMSIGFLAPKYELKCNTSIDSTKINETCQNKIWRSDMDETIISEFNLFGDRKWLADLAQSNTMLGILLGNFLFSLVADRIGRKIPLVIAIVLQSITGLLSALMPTYELFLVFKFISAVATGGTMLISFVLLMEVVGIKWRSTLSVLFHIPFIIGCVLIVPVAQYWKQWDYMLLTLSVPPILLLSYYWLIPESPRWLLAVGKIKEARKVLEEAARKNDVSMEKVNIAIESHENQTGKNIEGDQLKTVSSMDLFRSPNLRIRTICIAFNWFVCGMCYFGVSQYASRLKGLDLFMNSYISAASGLPGILLVWALVNRVSRLKLLMAGNVAAGLSLLAILCTPEEAHLALASIGVCGMSVSFTTIYLYSGELFPTVVRNAGIGLCSVCARVASMIAPWIATSDAEKTKETSVSDWLAPLIFGIGPLIGACLCLILPDTKDCKLPETIEDGENFGKKNRNFPMEATK